MRCKKDGEHAGLYLVEEKCSDAVGCQLHSVQHGDLDHPVGLCSS